MFGKDKQKVDFGEADLDDLGMDNLDWGSPFEETNTKRKSGARAAVTEFVSSAADVVKDRFLDRDTIRRLVSGGLHKGYTQAFNAYDAIETGIEGVLKDNANELQGALSSMKRRTDKWSPLAQRMLPKFLRDAMTEASTPSSSSAFSSEHQTELEANMAGLDKMFAFQAKQAADQNVRDTVRDTREQKRFATEAALQSNIGRGIGRLVGYQDSITINYHRKSLEIGYRQLDVAVRMLALQQSHFSETSAVNKDILKNTGLPDFIKMQHTEVLKQQMANRLASTVTNTVGNWASNFWGRTKNNASDMLKGFLQFQEGIDQQTQFGQSRAQAFGGQLGAMAGSVAGNFLENEAHAIINKLKPQLSKIPGFDATGENLRSMFTQVPQKINAWVKSETQSEGIKGWGEEFLKSMFDTYTATNSIGGMHAQDLDKPAIFDNLVYKSITEVMPGYLASIDKWIRQMATGEDQEEMAYSHYTGGFVDRGTLAQQHVRISLKNNAGRALRQEVDGLLRDMGAQDLSLEAMRALRIRLLKDMAGGHPFKPENYATMDAWDNVEESIADELITFFANAFGIQMDGTHSRDVKTNRKLNDVVDKYDAAQRRLPDFGERMNVLQKITGRRIWRDMGLSKYNGIEGDIIDVEALLGMLVDENSDEFDPLEPKPEGGNALKDYLRRQKKAEEDLLMHGVGNNDRVDFDRGVASADPRRRQRKQSSRPEKITQQIHVDLSSALANLPQPKVEFPELVKTSDEGTYSRLDSLIEGFAINNQFLADIIAKMDTLGSGGIGEFGGPGESGPSEASPGVKRRGLFGKLMGGVGWTAKKSLEGTWWYLKNSYKWIGKGTWGAAKASVWAAKAPFKPINGLGVPDIYVAGGEEPVILARDIKRGLYMDVQTKKIIQGLKDITGAVRKLDTDSIVLTEEDFQKGLYNGEGQSLVGFLTGVAGKTLGALAKGTSWYMGTTYGLMWKAAKKITEVAYDQFVQFDAYLPGDEEPRITSKKLKRGFYRTKEGNPIMSLKDITGPVFDIEGNEIISQEEIDKFKSLYTRNGSLLFTFGRGVVNLAGKAGELGLKAAKWYGRQVGKFYKGMWSVASGIGRFAGRLGRGMFGKGGGAVGMLDDELAEVAVEIQGQQLDTQKEILKVLHSAFDPKTVKGDMDGDGIRDYSWRDILRRRREAREGTEGAGAADNSDVVNALDKLGDRLDSKLDDLIDTTEEAGESSLLENAADLADIRDGMGGEGRGRRGRRGKAKVPKTKAGWMRRGWEATKGAAKWAWNKPIVKTAVTFGGSMLLRGGMWALGGAASLIGGAISLPALAIGAVVVGVAYLGYRYYKSERAKDFPLLYLRMTQYGVDPKDEERVKAMLELEKQCSRSVKIGQDGTASMDSSGIDMNVLSRIFKFEDKDRIHQFAQWVEKRYRPVYLAHCKAMNTIKGTTALQSADSSIGDGDLEAFLQIVDLDGMKDVYNDLDTSPFDSDLDKDADDVADAVTFIRDKRRLENMTKKKTNNAGTEVANKGLAGVAAAGAIASTANTAVSSRVGKKIVGVSAGGSDDPRRIAQGLQFAPMGIAAAAQATFTSKVNSKPVTTALNIPTAVRYKAYGLKDLEMAKCMQLQQVEDLYWDHVTYSGTSAASFGGNDDEVKQRVLDIFKPVNDVEKEEVLRWLDYRFVPVFLQYCISVRRRYNGDARDGWRNLTGTLMKEVLNETAQTQVETTFRSRSVWEIMNSPWQGYQMENMVGSVKLYIEALDTGDNSKVLDVAGMEAQKRTEAGNMKYGTKLTNVALGNQRANPVGPGVGNNNSTFGNMAKIYGGGAVAGGAQGQSTTGRGDGSMLYKGSFGNAVQHPGGGSGGDINSLPDNKGKGLQEMGPIITGAAQMVGFDPTIALNVAAVESGLNPNASSGIAHGLFQFIKGTWASMIKKYGPKYGIAPNTPPTDPRANAILGVCYLKENYEGLSNSLGGQVTDLDLYMAHFLGLGGARKFLSAPRADPSFMHVGNGSATPQQRKGDGGNGVTGSNKSIFFKDYKAAAPTQARNVGEVLAEMDRRMNIGRKIAGNPASNTPAGEPPASSVPSGGTPTNTAAANPAPTTDINQSKGTGSGVDKEEAAGATAAVGGSSTPSAAALAKEGAAPTEASAQVAPASPASVAAEANAGASGTPSSAMPMTVAQSINKPADPSMAPTDSSSMVTPTISPTTAAAREIEKTRSAEAQVSMVDTNNLLEQQLTVQKEQRQLLSEIKEILSKQGGPAAPAQPMQADSRSPQRTEPFTRKPLDTKRAGAVT